ncbi:ABC transporter [Armillaria solidipes]|uniref:ABC transporter n=1 Tax=Armillaria solidipes TaxID=1076256 RepID=A0A2H3ALI9_9AGAR|nr:ABC transporter [Armillaria solidipes]
MSEPETPKEAGTDSNNEVANDSEVTTVPMTRTQLVLVFGAFMLVFLLISLDQTIISTALPTIASHFQAVSDLSWIASAYFLPQAGLMLFFGRILSISSPKIVCLAVIAIFEIGSLFCAVAPSVNFLIFGRAFAGVGASGLGISCMYIVAKITTVRQRPVFMGLFGAVYSVASIIGPLIGGTLSDHVSWRWCFYINLPIGGAAFVAVALSLPQISIKKHNQSTWEAWRRLDWIGVFLSIAVVTLFLLPVQWGGNERPWSDPVVIVLLILSAITLAIFIAWEYRKGLEALLPLDMFMRRNMLGVCLHSFFCDMCFMIASYYLPFLYQLRGHSATKSGIDIIPFMIAGILASVLSGICISKLGYAWPFLFFGPLAGAVASGLMFSLNMNSSFARIAGYQILMGAGLGVALQTSLVVAQAEFSKDETRLSQATSMATFMKVLGYAVGLASGGGIFASRVRDELNGTPGLDPAFLREALSNIKFIFTLAPELQTIVLGAYVRAVVSVFLLSVATATISSIGCFLISRKKIDTYGDSK